MWKWCLMGEEGKEIDGDGDGRSLLFYGGVRIEWGIGKFWN